MAHIRFLSWLLEGKEVRGVRKKKQKESGSKECGVAMHFILQRFQVTDGQPDI